VIEGAVLHHQDNDMLEVLNAPDLVLLPVQNTAASMETARYALF
jgi:hypothetical protein